MLDFDQEEALPVSLPSPELSSSSRDGRERPQHRRGPEAEDQDEQGRELGARRRGKAQGPRQAREPGKKGLSQSIPPRPGSGGKVGATWVTEMRPLGLVSC